jgi:hypothetical protein
MGHPNIPVLYILRYSNTRIFGRLLMEPVRVYYRPG